MRYFVLGGSELLGTAIASAGGFHADAHEEREFEGGEHKARPLVRVRGEDVFIFHVLKGDAQGSANDKLLRLLIFIATCKENGAERVTALVPYLPYSRKDRQTKPRDPVTTRYVAQLFEAVGTDMIVTLDVHNPAAFQNAFRCATVHLTAARLFAKDLEAQGGETPKVFVSPDGGAQKRVQSFKKAYEHLSGRSAGSALMEKWRSEGTVSGELFAGDVEGADVIMADDMVVSGETLARTAAACKSRGALRISAYATHGLFSPSSREALAHSAIDELVVTDSVAPLSGIEHLENCHPRVISCAGLMGEAVVRLHGGGSIHRLLEPEE